MLSAELLFNFQGAPRLTLGGTASGLLVFDVLPSSYVHIISSVSKKIKLFSEISCELLHKEQCWFLSILPFV